jgi:hypothetical protein
MANAKRKSTIPARTFEIGKARRGKYTFFTRFDSDTKLVELRLTPLAKKVHGTRAVKAKIG